MVDILNEPLTLPCGAVIKNRIAKAGMTEGLADSLNRPTQLHQNLYWRWSTGGAGLVISGNVMVDRRYLEHAGNVAIEDHTLDNELNQWAKCGVVGGNHFWMQLGHAGRQTPRIIAARPVAPSAVPLRAFGRAAGWPKTLKEDEIYEIVARFAQGAVVAKSSGFTGVQIHAGHGYLISEFLSPLSNRRKDKWGGSIENRARFLLQIVRAARREVGSDFPVSVKLNAADFQKGGFSVTDCFTVAQLLETEGIDLLELSGGNYEAPTMLMGRDGTRNGAKTSIGQEAFFLQYAQKLRANLKTPLMVTGGFRSREIMVAALENNILDLIGLARPFCVQPDFPKAMLQGSLDNAPAIEHSLKLGPGPFGPRSFIRSVRQLNHAAVTAWCWMQMHRLSKNLELDWDLGLYDAMTEYLRLEKAAARDLVRKR
jgi:2,4-dienoyl-CoA reductase-like NADH-dependent reductase (Old Yellow Enzyme family)